MNEEGMCISKQVTTAIHQVAIPYDLIKIIIDIAIKKDYSKISILTQVNSDWRLATLFHRYELFRTRKSSKYLNWIEESGIKFDVSVYIKHVHYKYPNDILTSFTELNLHYFLIRSSKTFSLKSYSEERKFIAFIQSINSVKELHYSGRNLNHIPLSKKAFASLKAIKLHRCEIPYLFWNELCAKATKIRVISLCKLSHSFNNHFVSIKTTSLKAIFFGRQVPFFMIDLILGNCECFQLEYFDWHIETSATNTLRVFEKLKKCKSICYFGLSTCLDYSTENDEPNNSIDFSLIVSLCLDAKKKIERFYIESYTLTNFTRSNMNALIWGVKDYPIFRMSIIHFDPAIVRLVQEMKSEMIGSEDAFERIEFTYYDDEFSFLHDMKFAIV